MYSGDFKSSFNLSYKTPGYLPWGNFQFGESFLLLQQNNIKFTHLIILSVQFNGINYIRNVVQSSHYSFPELFHYPELKLYTH